jgi:hypothetical protein
METAAELAKSWIDAWNARDLEAVMSHYDPAVRFISPRARQAYDKTKGTNSQVGSPDGTIVGVDALRLYFAAGIQVSGDGRQRHH